MQKPRYLIRTMRRAELDIAVAWAAAEGWNPGRHDADCFHAADPGGFLIGLLDDQPISVLSVVKYGERFGFLGFYIVKPEYRGRGYGMQIWNAGLAYLAGRTIGLDGVVAQQGNYAKSGFTLAHRNIRFRGHAAGDRQPAAPTVLLAALPFDELLAYDQPYFPEGRAAFLRCWISQPEHQALAIRQDDRLAGYGVLRPCREGYKVGPLFADSPALAECLFVALKGAAPAGEPIFLDVPAVNRPALDMAQRHAMSVVFETARMYRGQAPALPLERLFGVTTFELG
ncbi:GNAT family N-acetyltransferase [Pseudomonas sp. LPB0260]|uniref:GNAT family N-acetyltransferase n=1 Tax=Pseudomonas sp. LPB0260 TaxID=2614442 RepID=UPI0015C27AEF|nr:GNAT family N-acetyltransferase [Pseudomonas sp. LPB0260]QLC72295.1 GNAT family N-acetyltransferase [Pseudomonas sp. LPB0260]QLC75072.1 GNAT family N-acetyltransferase [Pseudomonas sp. LPB0260]